MLLLGVAEALDAQQPAAETALTVARSGHFDSALALVASARAVDPDDPDLQLAEARVLSWAGRRREATARYDSLIQKNPRNTDALIGLGYLYHWQGYEEAADRQVTAALALDSANTDALELRHAIRRVSRGTVEASANWSNDSDRNTSFWQTVSLSAPLAGGFHILAGAGLLEASDPNRNATRFGGEAGLAWRRDGFRASALAGARRLNPETATARTEATYRGGLSWRPQENLGIAVGYARYPYDEIASLFERDLTIESLEGGFDVRPNKRFLVTGGGGALWLSDGNRRTEGHAAVMQDIGRHFQIGASGRALGYREQGVGYFSPDRFHLLEGTAAVHIGDERWDARLGGGLGGQQIGRGGDTQTEWHIDARVGRSWGDGNRVEGFGGVTNSAVSSTTGAFRYRTAGIVVRVGI